MVQIHTPPLLTRGRTAAARRGAGAGGGLLLLLAAQGKARQGQGGRLWRRCSTWRRGEARKRRVARLRAVIVDVLVAIGARTIGACAIEDALPGEKIYGASWDDPEPYYSALTGWRTTRRPSCPSSVLVGGCARARHHGGELRRSGDTAVVSLAQLPAASGLSCNRSHLLVMRKTSMGLKLLQPLLLLPVRFLPEGGLCPRASHTCAVPELLVLAERLNILRFDVRTSRRISLG